MNKVLNVLGTIFGLSYIYCAFFNSYGILDSIAYILIALPLISFFRNFLIKCQVKDTIRVYIYIGMIFLAFIFVCFREEPKNNGEIVMEETNEEQETVAKPEDSNIQINEDYSKYENSVVMNMVKPAWDYARTNNINIPNYAERKEIFDLLTIDNMNDILSQSIFVEMEKKDHLKIARGSYKYYKKTLDKTNTIYFGQVNKNSEPDGLGIVFQLYDKYTDDVVPLIKYIGYFDSGKYDGYGIEFEIFQPEEIPNIVDMESLINNLVLFNANEFYEGYFKDGDYSGEGVKCISNLYENAIVYSPDKMINANDLTYSYTIAEYSKNTINGESKEYYGNKLHYEGKQKEDEYHGYGKLYNIETGNLIYEGEFSHGDYHGKGILYDENGKVLHDGKFVAGEID